MLRSRLATQTLATLSATAAVQASAMVVLSLAAVLLPVADFARLSLIASGAMVVAGLLEFGLNIASTRFYCDTGNEGYLAAAFRIRLILVPLAAAAAALALLAGLGADLGLALLAGGVLNLWSGVRAADQARQDYRSFAASSLSFALLRTLWSGLGLWLIRDPLFLAAALYLLPSAGMLLSSSVRRMGKVSGSGTLYETLSYAVQVYLGAVQFMAFPYIPQFVVASRLDAAATGSYGLILTYLGPLSLVVYSLRSALLPRLLSRGGDFEDRLWSRTGRRSVLLFALVLALGGVLLSAFMGFAYEARFPGVTGSFLIFFLGFAATSALGLFTISVHSLGLAGQAKWVGLFRLLAVLVLLYGWGHTLGAIVGLTAAVMFVGEAVQFSLVWHERRRRRA